RERALDRVGEPGRLPARAAGTGDLEDRVITLVLQRAALDGADVVPPVLSIVEVPAADEGPRGRGALVGDRLLHLQGPVRRDRDRDGVLEDLTGGGRRGGRAGEEPR